MNDMSDHRDDKTETQIHAERTYENDTQNDQDREKIQQENTEELYQKGKAIEKKKKLILDKRKTLRKKAMALRKAKKQVMQMPSRVEKNFVHP